MMPQHYSDFEIALTRTQVCEDWPEALKAMWYDAKGDWEAAHDIAQDNRSRLGSWIHAYLHRKEGDRINAGHWYRLAGRRFPEVPLCEESKDLILYILEYGNNGNVARSDK